MAYDPTPILLEIQTLLQTRDRKATEIRIRRLGLGEACSRCGGTGHYSFNQVHGTTCYGCSGSRYSLPRTKKGWEACLVRSQEAATSGRVQEYVEKLQVAARVKGAYKKVFNAWVDSGNGDRYSWMLAATAHRALKEGKEIDERLQKHLDHSDFNERMHVQVKRVEALTGKIEWEKDATKRLDLELELAPILEDALEEIRKVALESEARWKVGPPTSRNDR